MDIEKIWNNWQEAGKFSGVFAVNSGQGIIFEKSCGFRNRSEKLLNNSETAFAVASVTKLFTGLAVCKLIDEGKLSLDSKLCDILPYDLGRIDKRVTIFQLLTHTSGIGDYIDEEAEDCDEQLEKLNKKYPVYLWERLDYYLQMITPLPPKFEPGARFGYSNAGFIILGLVIEAASGISYQQFVTDKIIKPCGLVGTGYYRMDALPANTAYGYKKDNESGEWRMNIFSMPVVGGSDGGLFTCPGDLDKLWRAIFAYKILSEKTTQLFLHPHAKFDENGAYGLGVYISNRADKLVYFAVGGDCGVDCFTAYLPGREISVSALGNSNVNTYSLLEAFL
ncbi:MAG: beta-lactamase family protein [Lachnospiraceae bacterium]|nr:beta-lactamase family protein [Lachnospiraceae bacterium]